MAKDVRREHGGDPVNGQFERLRSNDTSVHHQRVDGSADGCKAGTNRIQIGDVHDNDVEDAPAGRGSRSAFAVVALSRFRHAR